MDEPSENRPPNSVAGSPESTTHRPTRERQKTREEADPELVPAPARPSLSLEALPIAGITRRRMGWVLAALVTMWVVALFARQVGEASAAVARADQMRSANAALASQVAALQKERTLIQKQQYILQQARGYLLGEPREHPFTLVAPAPLGPNSLGSAALRLGAKPSSQAPLDSWLSLLFGPSR